MCVWVCACECECPCVYGLVCLFVCIYIIKITYKVLCRTFLPSQATRKSLDFSPPHPSSPAICIFMLRVSFMTCVHLRISLPLPLLRNTFHYYFHYYFILQYIILFMINVSSMPKSLRLWVFFFFFTHNFLKLFLQH